MKKFYDIVTNNMVFSHSSVTNFINCKHAFYLTYIEGNDRDKNWYSDFGLLIHHIMEEYLKDKLDVMQLSGYFEKKYPEIVTSSPPPFPKGIVDKYYNNGLEFFNTFNFDKNKYNIINVENKIETIYKDIKLIIRPDLILQEKDTNKIILLDFKTSNPFKNDKIDKKKMEDYTKQMYLYAYFINHTTNIKIDKIKLWFVLYDNWYEFDYVEEDAQNVIDWFYENIESIKSEEDFLPCDISKNKFFCSMLCSVRYLCKFYENFEIENF